jgi:N,N'-diacetylchitobiose phosphorylase
MQYGYFDDTKKEYVITSPDTPRSWSNYLGSTEYGAIITNNAGGYSFYKSAGQGRFTRIRFNSVPMDQPGRYLYIRDKESADYWSASWQPVGKPLDQYRSICRHGSAYTIIESEYADIKTETRYFVPLDQSFEVWHLKVTNDSGKSRELSLFAFVEYANNWNAMDDLLNLQYTQYTGKMDVIDGIISHGTNVNIPSMPDNFNEKDQGRFSFLAFIGGEIAGFETDLERFLGLYRTYANPINVEKGHCSNFKAAADNLCGVLQIDTKLKPGETKDFFVLMGVGKAEIEGKEVVSAFGNISAINNEFEKLVKYWHARIQGISVKTPDPEFNSMLNMWSPYNCLITFAWSRAASLVYTASERDGLGYRDSVQDLLGVMHNITGEAGKRLELMITGQVSTGGAMPVVNKVTHSPGKEISPEEELYRSDDCLWLFNAIPAYVNETGHVDFYSRILPYADKGEDTVLGHMRRAIQFNLDRSGKHGLPCGLRADWNDCLKFGHDGETTFVAMQLRFALKTYIEVCGLLDNKDEEAWAFPVLAKLDENIQKHAWDGEWFLRGYRFDGFKFGSKESLEGKIFMNPQVWAIISGAATDEQKTHSLQKIRELLATDYGIMLCYPPYTETDYNIVRAALFNTGMKENGSIFTHTQAWAVIAEALCSNGNKAYDYFRRYMPAAYNSKAEIRQIEPYVYCQSTHSKSSPRYGNSRVPWLSGSATWSFVAATQYILGLQPVIEGLRIDPCIPSTWKGFEATRRFRNMDLFISVLNPNGVEKGVKSIRVNGKVIEGNMVPIKLMLVKNKIEVIMG